MLATPHTILNEQDTFKLPTLSTFRNRVSVYPDVSQDQDLWRSSFCRRVRARVPVVQHLRAAQANHSSCTWIQAALSAIKSIGQVISLEKDPYVLLPVFQVFLVGGIVPLGFMMLFSFLSYGTDSCWKQTLLLSVITG